MFHGNGKQIITLPEVLPLTRQNSDFALAGCLACCLAC
jgi:hypothetical protein